MCSPSRRTGSQPAAVEPEVRRRKARQAPDHVLQGCGVLVSDEPAEHAGERSIRPRVRLRQQEYALRRERARIRSEAHPRQRDLPPQVLGRGHEDDHPNAALVFQDQVHRHVAWVGAALSRDLTERSSGERLQALVLERHEHDALGRAGGLVQVLPVLPRASHLVPNACSLSAVAQARERRAKPALMRPRREAGAEARCAGLVRIHIGCDGESGCARALDPVDDRVELLPVRATRLLEVVDLRGQPRAPRDLDDLIHALEQSVPFAAHVRDVHAAVLAGDLRQRDELVGVGVRRRRVDERRADAERAAAHRRVDKPTHTSQLVTGRPPIVVPQLVDPHRRGADERSDVRRDAAGGDRVERLGQRRPGDVVPDVALLLGLLAPHGLAQRTE